MNYDLKALDKALDARIKEKKLPGVSCAIYGPDGVILKKATASATMNTPS